MLPHCRALVERGLADTHSFATPSMADGMTARGERNATHDQRNATRVRRRKPPLPSYASANFCFNAALTHSGTNCSTSPPIEDISRTMELDRYMCCGSDMMNSVSNSGESW